MPRIRRKKEKKRKESERNIKWKESFLQLLGKEKVKEKEPGRSVFACRAISPRDVYCTSQGKHLPLLFCLVVCVKLIRKAQKHRQTSFISTAWKQLKSDPSQGPRETTRGGEILCLSKRYNFVYGFLFTLSNLLHFVTSKCLKVSRNA